MFLQELLKVGAIFPHLNLECINEIPVTATAVAEYTSPAQAKCSVGKMNPPPIPKPRKRRDELIENIQQHSKRK